MAAPPTFAALALSDPQAETTTSPNSPTETSVMSTITTAADGTRIFYKGLGPRGIAQAPSSSITAGRSKCRRLGQPDALSSCPRLMRHRFTTGVRPRPLRTRPTRATRWKPTPPTSRELRSALDLEERHPHGLPTGGGEVTRYVARCRARRVSKAPKAGRSGLLIMLKTEANRVGLAAGGVRRSRGAGRQPRAVLATSTFRPDPSTASTARARSVSQG